MQLLFTGLRTLLLVILLPWPVTGQFHVKGPRSPVIALVGEEAVLPCHLSPSMDAQRMEIKWYHSNQSGLLHHYRDFQDQMEQQNPEYQGRTKLLKENITKGQVALRIHTIQPSDGGNYSCFFVSSTYYNEARFEVLVTGLGMDPHIHIETAPAKGLKLTCTSTGWYPEPEVQWEDSERWHLIPDTETKTADGKGLFYVETSIMVDRSSNGNVSCFIRNPVLGVKRGVYVSIADAVFPSTCTWMVMWAVFISFLVLGLINCVLYVRARKTKGSLKKKYELLIKQKGEKDKENAELLEKCEKISQELEERTFIGEQGLNKIRKFAEDIILDETTAHPYLAVSPGGKSVLSMPNKQDVPNNPERFDTMPALLGQSSFSTGNHYWEVEVAGNSKWTLGLCVDSVSRKGQYIPAKPEKGFWTLCLKDGKYKALATPSSILKVPGPLSKVGIFLKYEEGSISFYNVTEFTILYTFKSKFTEPLRPYFYPGPNSGLSIVKVPEVDPGSPS